MGETKMNNHKNQPCKYQSICYIYELDKINCARDERKCDIAHHYAYHDLLQDKLEELLLNAKQHKSKIEEIIKRNYRR